MNERGLVPALLKPNSSSCWILSRILSLHPSITQLDSSTLTLLASRTCDSLLTFTTQHFFGFNSTRTSLIVATVDLGPRNFNGNRTHDLDYAGEDVLGSNPIDVTSIF